MAPSFKLESLFHPSLHLGLAEVSIEPLLPFHRCHHDLVVSLEMLEELGDCIGLLAGVE